MNIRRAITAATVGSLLAAAGMGVGVADAKSARVIKQGACSGAADWKLKVGAEDANKLEVQIEIEDARPGSAWRVSSKLNGSALFSVNRTASSLGAVRVSRVVQGTPGADTVSFVATSGGQTCTGSATL